MWRLVIFLTLNYLFSVQNLFFTCVIKSHPWQVISLSHLWQLRKNDRNVMDNFFFHFWVQYLLHLNHQPNITIVQNCAYYEIFCKIFFFFNNLSQGTFYLLKWNATFDIDFFFFKMKRIFVSFVNFLDISLGNKSLICRIFIEFLQRFYISDDSFLSVCGIPHNLIKNIFKWVFTQFFNTVLFL